MPELEPPTLSEVVRRIDNLSADIKEYAKDSVSALIYQNDNIARDREMRDVKADMAKVQAELDAEIKSRLNSENETRKERENAGSSKRLMWISIFATPIAVLLINWVANGGLSHVAG